MVKSSFTTYTIPTVFSFIDSERIVVPSFQRGFVWKKSQVANFLQSIYLGYPIGTLIFLDELASRFDALSLKDFKPISAETEKSSNSLLYVLDGSQRLSALYKSLYANDPEFSFVFNLDTEEFLPKSRYKTSETSIDLQSLFSPDLFLHFQKSISLWEDREFFFDKARNLHNAFSMYHIPIQIYSDITVDDAISITQIINTSGKHLQKSDLERMWRKY